MVFNSGKELFGGKSTKDAEKINSFILLLTIIWSIAEQRDPLFQEIDEPLILTKCQSLRLEIKLWSFSTLHDNYFLIKSLSPVSEIKRIVS